MWADSRLFSGTVGWGKVDQWVSVDRFLTFVRLCNGYSLNECGSLIAVDFAFCV